MLFFLIVKLGKLIVQVICYEVVCCRNFDTSLDESRT